MAGGTGARFGAVLVLLCSLLVLAGVLGLSGSLGALLHPAAVAPEIVPVAGYTLENETVYTFPFGQGNETIRVRVDPAVYGGAKEADKAIYLYENFTREEWLPLYYRAFIDDADQEPFYTALLAEFRAIRDREGLDADRYLELLVVFVQSIPYETDSLAVEPKFPVETFVDGRGDCDDKSLLLAALLAREGYGTALFSFEAEEHMAVGVNSTGCLWNGMPYAYIEATNVSYVGILPNELADGTVLASAPIVVPVGNGTGAYENCTEIEAIRNARDLAYARILALAPLIDARQAEYQALYVRLAELRAELDRLSTLADHQGYNALVPGYNALLDEYKRSVDEYNRLIEESEASIGLYNRIVLHAYDRPGTYRLVAEHLPEALTPR
ncbi:hypothetical protein ABH15_00345 [Methanoculleus taiwanensis]|uniref:Transglutaminase-like domain-containing protein n=1 Tax=Methanoculleus taiwanensis TaxID=1550565 RepID=A0A498H1V4_9EURY|nr:adhesion protein FadA [Methanoculleus taiwanensis]RXE56673.1 hypothetical protein ABH15_00345 [Methanoculleus taiwanensis]